MSLRKSAEVYFRKSQKPQKSAIFVCGSLRKSAELASGNPQKTVRKSAEVLRKLTPSKEGYFRTAPFRGFGGAVA